MQIRAATVSESFAAFISRPCWCAIPFQELRREKSGDAARGTRPTTTKSPQVWWMSVQSKRCHAKKHGDPCRWMSRDKPVAIIPPRMQAAVVSKRPRERAWKRVSCIGQFGGAEEGGGQSEG